MLRGAFFGKGSPEGLFSIRGSLLTEYWVCFDDFSGLLYGMTARSKDVPFDGFAMGYGATTAPSSYMSWRGEQCHVGKPNQEHEAEIAYHLRHINATACKGVGRVESYGHKSGGELFQLISALIYL